MTAALKKICQRCVDQSNSGKTDDETGVINIAALRTGNELREFGEKNLDFKNSELEAVLTNKVVRTSYHDIETKCAHLSDDEKKIVREAIAAEIAHTVFGRRLMKVVAEAAATKFIDKFTNLVEADGTQHWAPTSLAELPTGQEDGLKCNVVAYATETLTATGIPSKRVLQTAYDKLQKRLQTGLKNNEYYVIANQLVRSSVKRAKTQRELDKQTAEQQTVIANKITSSIKVQLTSKGTPLDAYEAFITEFAANMAERIVPDLPPTSAGQIELADFVAKITKQLEVPMRKAAIAANPTKSVPTDQKLHVSYKMIMHATLNGKANEETMKALAKAAKQMSFDPHSSDNNDVVNRAINIGDGIQRVLADNKDLDRHLDFAIPPGTAPDVLAWVFLEHIAKEAIKPFIYSIKLHFTSVSTIFDVAPTIKKFCEPKDFYIKVTGTDDAPADSAQTAKTKCKNFLNSIAGTPAAVDQEIGRAHV